MNKTATITWVKWNNFGSLLQAYALQQTVKNLGYDNNILDDSKVISGNNRFLKKVKSIFYPAYISLSIDKNKKKFYKYNKEKDLKAYLFKKKYLSINGNIEDSSYDQFIFGSDQIWTISELTYNPYYFGNFTQKKKISYAPSMDPNISSDKSMLNEIKSLLLNFSSLSMRERDGAEIVRKITNKEVSVVLDPTLLLSIETWNKFVSQNDRYNGVGEYVLCYFLKDNDWYIKESVSFAQKNKLRVKFLGTLPSMYNYYPDFECCDPIEFLSLIKNAKYIFTDSYHCSIFSVLFKKIFYTFKINEEGRKSTNARIENLFLLLGLSDYYIGKNELGKIYTLPKIDFDIVHERLKKGVDVSIEYLKNALTN